MTSPANLTTNLVDNLNAKSLLGLAADEGHADAASSAHSLPSADELQSLFPELKIKEMVGSGGMGCVFRAQQTRLERHVALKLLPPELSNDGMFAERFAREARAMARLNHPNIVSIHDFGETNGLHYLVMEFMDGMNLRELLEAGPLPLADVLRIFESVCQALAYAHAEGVIHRDIKPENILFSKMGNVALADFGLARLAKDSTAAVSITQTRQAMGTLNYMAPEQWENPKAVDFRADIYSLGILLYEMLTGRIPRGSFPPASTLSDATPAIDDAIHMALQIDAADRHSSVRHFCQAVVQQPGTTAEPLGFDQNGTLTNFMNIGANVFKSIPVPMAASTDRLQTTAVWFSLMSAILVTMLCNCTWLVVAANGQQSGNAFQGMDTFVVVEGVQIPIELIPFASALLFILALLRKKIHPLRADVLSLVICGLSIALVALSFDDLQVRVGTQARGNLTVSPFLTLGVLAFQAVETLIRIGYLASIPFRKLYDWIRSYCEQETQKEQQKKAERKALWQALWKSFVSGWHELTGMDKRKPD